MKIDNATASDAKQMCNLSTFVNFFACFEPLFSNFCKYNAPFLNAFWKYELFAISGTITYSLPSSV